MKKVILALVCTVLLSVSYGQKSTASGKPKLVVGLVIDQMRWDYLHRYADRYTANGFKRLMREGFNCNNTFINYTPTYTAAGHATIYTGTVPAAHGIMGNYWYSRVQGRNVYCTEDSTVQPVGTTSNAGKNSPANMWSTTITDEVRLSTNFRSKVIGVALKDRGAILPAGHSANAAYWFDNVTGSFITSSYYVNELPTWVKSFNERKLPDHYLQQNWNTLYPISSYTQSSSDVKLYENNLPREDNSFPHITDNITRDKYNSFKYTPYANTYTFEMGKAAIEGEQLGKGDFTDVLALSCSTTDYIGHEFGPNSIEIEDTYLRLDKDIASFLSFLDNKIGKGQYLVFLTADHGATHVPGFLHEYKIPAGVLDDKKVETHLNSYIKNHFNIDNGVSKVVNYQVYFSDAVLDHKEYQSIADASIKQMLTFPAIAAAFQLKHLNVSPIPSHIKNMMVNGYNQRLSGDIQFLFKPQYYDGWEKGTSHGVWYNYDSHIPLIFFGTGIKKGSTYRKTYMTDIAATIAALLNVQMPSASIGEVIEEVMK